MALPQLNEQIFCLSPTFVLADKDPNSAKVPYTKSGGGGVKPSESSGIPIYKPQDGGRFPTGTLIGECANTIIFKGTDGREYIEVQCEGWNYENHVFWAEWFRTFPHGFIPLADEGVYWVRESYRSKTPAQIQDEQAMIAIRAEFATYTGVIAPDNIYKEKRADGTQQFKVAWNSGYSQWWDIFQALPIASKVTFSHLTKEEYTKLSAKKDTGTEDPEDLAKQIADLRKQLTAGGTGGGNGTTPTWLKPVLYTVSGLALLGIAYALYSQSRKKR